MTLAVVSVVALTLLLILIATIAITTYNTVIALRRRCERALANVEVALKQRYDELPNLVGAVRGQLGFERHVLEEVTRLRSAFTSPAPLPDRAATAEATSRAIRQLFAVVEAYPDLRSQQNVLALQDEIERLETLIARRRELLNEQIYQHNTAIRQLPGVLLAALFAWHPLEFFDADPAEHALPEGGLLST